MRSVVTFAFIACLSVAAAKADGDLTRQEPVVVRVSLGTADNPHTFAPNTLVFETGKLYRLVLHNPSRLKHYFSSPGLAERVFTRKVQVMDGAAEDAVPISEIKGAIREIEVFPGHTAEWWFVPVATLEGAALYCEVKDDDGKTHLEKGMVGTIDIK